MKQFLTRSFLFAIPLLLWTCWIVAIDPYNYFQSSLVSIEAKEKTSFRINVFTSTMIQYTHAPSDHILIGDSRTKGLPLPYIQEVSGMEYKTLAIPAAKLNEMLDLMYFAHEQKPLKHVVTGIHLSMFNRFSYADRVGKMKNILSNPLLYIFNRPIAQSSFQVMKYLINGTEVVTVPDMSKEEAWEYFMTERARHWYERFEYAEDMEKRFAEFSSFAKQNDIKWTIILVPHHTDFQEKLISFGRKTDLDRFHLFLSKLHATVIDYDVSNDITSNIDNFDDPVHYTPEVGKKIVDEVWNRTYSWGHPIR